jgi:CHAD domain-containing protein
VGVTADRPAPEATPPIEGGSPSAPSAPSALPALGASPGPIAAGDPLAIAGRKAMWPHVERLLAREGGIRDPDRPDELRKYRVATRRLRAALRLFESAYPKRQAKPIRTGLTDLARSVGAVRDLDLRIAGIRSWVRDRDDVAAAAVEPLVARWELDRDRARAILDRRLDSRRHRRFLETLVAFVDDAPRAPDDDPRTVRDRAASQVWTAYERLRAFGPKLPAADNETLHDIRIEAKRLRYALEFLGNVLGPRQPLLVERLVGLQDHLGALNDVVVAADAARSYLAEDHATAGPETREAAAAYLGDVERSIAELRRGVDPAWRPVASPTFARRLGATVVIA